MPHVGICAGGAEQLASLPRPFAGMQPERRFRGQDQTGGGGEILSPSGNFIHWDWHQSDKSQGPGDGVPRSESLLRYQLISSVPLFCKLPYFRRTHVSAFNICMSLFR